MSEESKVETVRSLIARIGAALEKKEIDKVEKTCGRLGPHVLTLERQLVACEGAAAAGYAQVAAGVSSLTEALGVMEIEKAAQAASALQIDTATIAECVEEVLRIADARCEMDVVKRVTEWLTKQPELGLLVTDPNPPATWRPVRTWRLHEVHPETADGWTNTARKLMRDARMRSART